MTTHTHTPVYMFTQRPHACAIIDTEEAGSNRLSEHLGEASALPKGTRAVLQRCLLLLSEHVSVLAKPHMEATDIHSGPP